MMKVISIGTSCFLSTDKLTMFILVMSSLFCSLTSSVVFSKPKIKIKVCEFYNDSKNCEIVNDYHDGPGFELKKVSVTLQGPFVNLDIDIKQNGKRTLQYKGVNITKGITYSINDIECSEATIMIRKKGKIIRNVRMSYFGC